MVVTVGVCESCGKMWNRDTRMTVAFDGGVWLFVCKPCGRIHAAAAARKGYKGHVFSLIASLARLKRFRSTEELDD